MRHVMKHNNIVFCMKIFPTFIIMELTKALTIFKININKHDLGKTKKELKTKYKEIALQIHPDKSSDPKASEKFQQLQHRF